MQFLYSFLFSFKKELKKLWSFKETIKVIYNYFFISYDFSLKIPKVYYGGSLKGDLGGPLVKIKKLNKFFPEHNWKFNMVYLLSNSTYLNPSSINFIKEKRIPIVLNQNGVFYPQWFEGDWQKENSKMSQIYQSADYVLWQSYFCKKASENFLGKRIGKGEILYNSVDTSFFIPKIKSYSQNFTFLITGNIRKKSNYRISSVLFALKELIKEKNNIRLIIAGFIEDKVFFKQKIKKLKLENYVNFLGKYSQNDAPKIYQKADAYITMSYQDNCPTAVLEAMACGLPILYSASGGVPELVCKNSGLGIDVKENWEDTQVPEISFISSGMSEIIENRISMSEASRTRAVEFFDLKKWIIRHKIIFEKLLDQ